MSKRVGWIFISFLLVSCFKKEEVSSVDTVVVKKTSEDFLIPKGLIRVLEDDLLAESKVLNPVFHFVPVKISLFEKTPKTLKSPQIEYQLPKGGGAIDLADVVTGQGSFFISIPQEQFSELPELVHLFYVSQAPKKNLDGEEFGLGCGKWIDIKDKYSSLNKPNFLSLNTTGFRHLYVAAGHYVLAFRKSNQIYLTQFTITDSKNEEILCPRVKGPGL